MKTNSLLLGAGIVGFGMLAATLVLSVALAQAPADINDANIQYPIAELGNCENKDTCKTYCDAPANLKACIAYAEKNNLMSEGEVRIAKKFLDAGAKGPGGCTGKDSCETYCNDISHINECVAYAEKIGILSPQELQEAKQVQAAIARGVKPPPCKNKKECDVYCEEPQNIKACIAFGEAAGFLKGQELQDAQKMIAAVERGVKPPPCRGKKACDEYCSTPENMEVCMTFAKEAGFMSPKEVADSEKMLQALRKGVKPPACRGKEECDLYCQSEEHIEECMNFAIAAGFMNEKEAEMARKTGGKGPGGCFGKETCEAFCQNPANQEICMNFAIEYGMMSKEDMERMRQGMQGGEGIQGPPPGALDRMPPEVAQCLENALGSEGFEKMKRGEFQPSGEEGRKVGQCFQIMGGPGQGPGMPGQGEPGMAPGAPMGGSFVGPGGCTTPEACKAYCESNPVACQNFQPQGTMPSGQMQPMMPPQGQESGPSQYPAGTMPPQEGMPLYQTLPLNQTMPYDGTMPPPPEGTQPMMQQQQGELQPMMPPPDGTLPPPPSPEPIPTSLNSLDLLGFLVGPFLPILGF